MSKRVVVSNNFSFLKALYDIFFYQATESRALQEWKSFKVLIEEQLIRFDGKTWVVLTDVCTEFTAALIYLTSILVVTLGTP